MLPFPLIPMAVRNIPWRLIGAGIIVLGILGAGYAFRSVLADRERLTAQNGAQAAEIANVTAEVERMNRQDAADNALRENIEVQKKILAAELSANLRDLKKAKEALNEATRNCLDMPLSDSYLRLLPKDPAKGN